MAVDVEKRLFEEKKSKQKKRRYIYVALGFVALVFVLWGVRWALWDSEMFRVEDVVVKGNERVAKAEIIVALKDIMQKHSRLAVVLGGNRTLFWREGAVPELRDAIPFISDATVVKEEDGRHIIISVTERELFGVWCVRAVDSPANSLSKTSPSVDVEHAAFLVSSPSQCMWFSKEAILLAPSLEVEGGLIPFVRDTSGRVLALGEHVLGSSLMENFLSVIKATQDAKVAVKEFRLIHREREEIEAYTYEGPALYFSLRFRADHTAPLIASFRGKGNFSSLAYIDFRVPQRAYYRSLGETTPISIQDL